VTALVANTLLASPPRSGAGAARRGGTGALRGSAARRALREAVIAGHFDGLRIARSRTPLTAIRALAQDIAADDSGACPGRIIVGQADRLNKLVADVLDLSRLKGGAVTINAEVNR
jgi:signal transduction histidine kinase